MMRSAVIVAVLFLSTTQAINLLKFALDFTSLENTGRLKTCNFINCWGTDNLYLVKQLSANFRCSVTVNPPSRPISDWYVPHHLQLFVLDSSCPNAKEFLKEAEQLGLFNGNFLWLLVNSIEVTRETGLALYNGSTAVEMLKDVDVTVISQVHVANRVSGDKLEIMGFYKRDPTDQLIPETLGYWTLDEGLVFTAVASPATRRQNLEGRLFKGSVVIWDDDSLNHVYDLVDTQKESLSKLNIIFYDLVIQGMNATIEYIVARKWGEVVNGTFDGMIGYAQRGEADFVITPVFMNTDRLKVLHYVTLTHPHKGVFFFLAPPLSYKNNIFLLPFSLDVWYCCTILFGVFVLLLYAIATYEEKNSQHMPENVTMVKPLTRSWLDILLLNLATICQQDVCMEPRSICGRTVVLLLKIADLFIYVSYSAAIVVLLQSSDRSITTLRDLQKSEFRIGFDDTPYNKFYTKTASDPVRKALVAKSFSGKRPFLPLEQGMKEVGSGFYAYHTAVVSGYLSARRLFDEVKRCHLQQLEETFLPNLDTLTAVRKHLPYIEIVTVTFRRIAEYGLVRRESERKTAKKPACKAVIASYSSVGLVDCEAAFVLLFSGIFMSFCIFVLELCVDKLKKRRMKENLLQYGFYN